MEFNRGRWAPPHNQQTLPFNQRQQTQTNPIEIELFFSFALFE